MSIVDKANLTSGIPGFKGAATIRQRIESNKATGSSVEQLEVNEGMKLTVLSYSITTIMLK